MRHPTVQLSSIPAQEAYARMHYIVQKMKEIPVLPSEVPKDVSALSHIEFPDEGGIHSYMDGYTAPFKGFPFADMVEEVDIMKKLCRGVVSSFFHSLKKRPRWQLALVALVPWVVTDAIKAAVYTFYRRIERLRIKNEFYSDSMRELYRAFGDGRTEFRDLVCMTLEFDNAYRFRFQDIIVELDKEALKKNPAQEVTRLLTLMQSREKEQSSKDTWTLCKRFIPLLLFLNPQWKRGLVDVLTELDLTKVTLSKEDKSYCIPRKDYHFGFMEDPAQKEFIDLVMSVYHAKDARQAVRDESTKAHNEMFERHRKELGVSDKLDEQIMLEIAAEEQKFLVEAREKSEISRRKILQKHLTKKQFELLEKQKEENRQMDELYNAKLNSIS